MATPKETLWSLDPHTLAKHAILRRYLQAWFPILGSHNQRIIYLDGFCGPGRYKGGEPGSPVIALQEAAKHASRLAGSEVVFIFMDERQDRIDSLSDEIMPFKQISNFRIFTLAGQFEVKLRQILDDLNAQGFRLAPTFAFIDPFGFKGLPFQLVRRLIANPKTDVLINVMTDSINRWLSHPDAKVRQHLVDQFGTNTVLDVPQMGANRHRELRRLYQQQLEGAAKYVRFFEMLDCNGRVLYDLFFASQHPLGHKKIKEAFWAVDPDGGYCFSDATNPSQMVLFQEDPVPALAAQLKTVFAGTTVTATKMKEFVTDNTAFIEKHVTAALSTLEDHGDIHVHPLISDRKRRRHTFGHVTVTFASKP